MSELQVMQQFFADNGEGLREKFNELSIKNIVDCVKLDAITTGDFLIDIELSVNGGHIIIREIKESTTEHWNTYGDRFGLRGINQTFLIEHPDYKSKHVEPYNRQGGFYVGCSFSDLDKNVLNDWNVYSCVRNENINLQTGDFYYNNFWNNFRFNVAVKKESIIPMIEEIMSIVGFDKTAIENILQQIN